MTVATEIRPSPAAGARPNMVEAHLKFPSGNVTYEVVKVIQRKARGSIFTVRSSTRDLMHEGALVVKTENRAPSDSLIPLEFSFLEALREVDEIPRVVGFIDRVEGSAWPMTAMLMEHLGASLDQLQHDAGGTFNLNTTIIILEQGLQRLKDIHNRGIIHRDIKPENFAIGLGDRQHIVHLFDFGFGKWYRGLEDGEHIKPQHRNVLSFGSVSWASLHTHRNHTQSRRDDLESLAYMAIYSRLGTLPWDRETNWSAVYTIKLRTPTVKICRGLPEEFRLFLESCRSLGFYEEPKYDYWLEKFGSLRRSLAEKEEPLEWMRV